MKRTIAASLLGLSLFVSGPSGSFAETYDDCVLKNMKGVQSEVAVKAVQAACYSKTLPRKCAGEANRGPTVRPTGGMTFADLHPELFDSTRRCIAECRSANWFSRTWGECSPQ